MLPELKETISSLISSSLSIWVLDEIKVPKDCSKASLRASFMASLGDLPDDTVTRFISELVVALPFDWMS